MPCHQFTILFNLLTRVGIVELKCTFEGGVTVLEGLITLLNGQVRELSSARKSLRIIDFGEPEGGIIRANLQGDVTSTFDLPHLTAKCERGNH